MGGGHSIASGYKNVYNQVPSLQVHKKEFETICLTPQEVKCLYDVYCQVEQSEEKTVDIDAIFLILGIKNDFLRKIFTHTLQLKMRESNVTVASDADGHPRTCHLQQPSSEECMISFDVFVYAIWAICSIQPSFFELFVFDMYMEEPDQENLSSHEIQQMISDIYGSDYEENFYAKRAINILKDNDNIDDYFDIDDFYEFTFHNNVVQFAVFVLQTRLQSKICDFSYWEKIGEKRYRTFYGYSSIAEILKWGNVDEDSIASRSTRRFSDCSGTQQSRFILGALRANKADDDDSDEESQQGRDSVCKTNAAPGGNKVHDVGLAEFHPTFTAYSSQHRRGSSSKIYNTSGIDMNRRRSFDVKVIIKEKAITGDKKEVVNRRHSVVV